MVREEEAGCSQAICSKNPKERFAQAEVQSWVQDVTSKDGLLKGGGALVVAHSTGMQAEGPVEAREEGCLGRGGLTRGAMCLAFVTWV